LYTNFTFCVIFWETNFPSPPTGALRLGPTGGLPSRRLPGPAPHQMNPSTLWSPGYACVHVGRMNFLVSALLCFFVVTMQIVCT